METRKLILGTIFLFISLMALGQNKFDLTPDNMIKFIGKVNQEQFEQSVGSPVGEEEGFIGSAAVLLLFLTLILRIIHLAERQPPKFGRVYGYSIASILFFHVLINVGMVMGLMPVIGIPLPFFSYGGSSLWGFTLMLFIFLRIDAGRKARER